MTERWHLWFRKNKLHLAPVYHSLFFYWKNSHVAPLFMIYSGHVWKGSSTVVGRQSACTETATPPQEPVIMIVSSHGQHNTAHKVRWRSGNVTPQGHNSQASEKRPKQNMKVNYLDPANWTNLRIAVFLCRPGRVCRHSGHPPRQYLHWERRRGHWCRWKRWVIPCRRGGRRLTDRRWLPVCSLCPCLQM